VHLHPSIEVLPHPFSVRPPPSETARMQIPTEPGYNAMSCQTTPSFELGDQQPSSSMRGLNRDSRSLGLQKFDTGPKLTGTARLNRLAKNVLIEPVLARVHARPPPRVTREEAQVSHRDA
jgi:hypothetical protein